LISDPVVEMTENEIMILILISTECP